MDYSHCNLCPRACGVNREAGQTGFCGCPAAAIVSKAMLHKWEEPVLARQYSGAVFFGGCTLQCVYCQNRAISGHPRGDAYGGPGLRKLYFDLIAQGAENIDLITPSQFLPTVIDSLRDGLPVPVVYNCGGYESRESIAALNGLVDIYLPDMKYADGALAGALSGAEDYFPVAARALREMAAQVGPVRMEDGRMKKGVLVRHLILPSHVENSLKVLDFLGENFRKGEILVSLMRQYTPVGKQQPPLNRTVSQAEYEAVLSWMYLNGLDGFTQEAQAAAESFIPDFQPEKEL